MNKILKTISFLLLSVCFMLNVNVAHAGCNESKVVEETLSNGQRIKKVFIPHDELVSAAESEQSARGMFSWICSAVAFFAPVEKVKVAAGGIGLFSSFPKLQSESERWLEESNGCGVIVTYLFQHHPGGYYHGGGGVSQAHDSWDFHHVEPQW